MSELEEVPAPRILYNVTRPLGGNHDERQTSKRPTIRQHLLCWRSKLARARVRRIEASWSPVSELTLYSIVYCICVMPQKNQRYLPGAAT
jgi:hypothetical protein